MELPQFDTVKLLPVKDARGVAEVRICRKQKRNALSDGVFQDLARCFAWLENAENEFKVVLLTGEGPLFCSGIDLSAMTDNDQVDARGETAPMDNARKALQVLRKGQSWQNSLDNMENCRQVVISCVHGACLGAGLEMICASDIRFCTEDAFFRHLELDLGIAADIGGLQRFPKIVGNSSLVRELAFSGRHLPAHEALRFGLVSRVCRNQQAMMEEAVELSKKIASKSPVGLLGAKRFLNYNRDHTVKDSLDYAIAWNMGLINGSDVQKSALAMMSRSKPEFDPIKPGLNRMHFPPSKTSKL